MAGDHAKAANSVAIVEDYAPWIGVDDIANVIPYRTDELRARFRHALMKAGFKT
jgi:hypothetical protein